MAVLALIRRWLSRSWRLSPDLKHLDDGVVRLGFGDDPWDVWGDE